MKRKLFALLLSSFAFILMIGAGIESPALAAEADNDAVTAEVKLSGQEKVDLLQVQAGAGDILQDDEAPAQESVLEDMDYSVLVDGQPVPKSVSKYIDAGVSYVSLADMAVVLDPKVQISWDKTKETMMVSTESLKITAVNEYSFLEANGRYLYVSERVKLNDGRIIVPLKVVAKAFGASVGWDEASQTVLVTKGSGTIESGKTYYNEDALFWLSRVIYAESGGEVMKGMVAVGNVVMNRVASNSFPNTIYGVISQKNQFSTFKNGRLANCTPTERSIIAAKIVLDGGVVKEVKDAYFFDAFRNNSWAARNKAVVAAIGGHRFYG